MRRLLLCLLEGWTGHEYVPVRVVYDALPIGEASRAVSYAVRTWRRGLKGE